MVIWKGLRFLAEASSNKCRNHRTRNRRTALHLSRRPPPTLHPSANMHLNSRRPTHHHSTNIRLSNRQPPTLKTHMAKDRMPLSLHRHSSPHRTTRNPHMPYHRRKLRSHTRTQTTWTTACSVSFWPAMLRARVDAVLETLYRYPRMPTSLSLHLPHLHQL